MIQPADPALPDRSPGASKSSFKWPCDRRDAHGPHERRWVGNKTSVFDPKTQKSKEGDRLYSQGTGILTVEKDCPGVGSHPATMAGGSYDRG